MNRYRFPKALRLLQRQSFSRVFKDSNFRSSDNVFSILAAQSVNAYPRLGLAIAKKKVKKSVARQRLKRLVRESFRRHQHAIEGWDIVVMAQVGADKADNPQVFTSLEKHWERLSKRCKK